MPTKCEYLRIVCHIVACKEEVINQFPSLQGLLFKDHRGYLSRMPKNWTLIEYSSYLMISIIPATPSKNGFQKILFQQIDIFGLLASVQSIPDEPQVQASEDTLINVYILE
jgi:hypothetical protein